MPAGLVASIVTTSDGRELRAAQLVRPQSRGTVVIAPGRGDFIERWFETIGDLARRNYAVAVFDFRGQGGSERQGLRHFSEYDADLYAVMTRLVLTDCPPPYYALGHSTGGLIVLRALQRHPWFERAVLSAPLLGIHTGAWPMPVLRIASALMPSIGLGRVILPGQGRRPLGASQFKGNRLTADKRRYLRSTSQLEANAELGVGGPDFAWLRAGLGAIEGRDRVTKSNQRFLAPVLIVGAGRDQVVLTEAQHGLARLVSGVACVVIPDARHEILHEGDAIREQFFAAFDSFMDR
ncbi:alpha/beta hydrolase [soil metagenome]